MPFPKEFYFVGSLIHKKGKSTLFLFAGITGAFIVLYGFTQIPAQGFYVTGAALLLLTAIYFKLTYFIALEIILLAGHGALFFGIGPILQVVLPIMLCMQLLVYYLLSGELRVFRLIGITGIAMLSIGFSYENLWIFFFGSLTVGIFALYQVYQGKHVALIWAILNLAFTFTTFFILIL